MDVPTVIRILCGLSLDVNDVGLPLIVGQQEKMPHNKSQTSDEEKLGYQEHMVAGILKSRESVCAEDRLKKTHKHRRQTKNNVRSIEGDLINSLIYEDANDAFSVAVTDIELFPGPPVFDL